MIITLDINLNTKSVKILEVVQENKETIPLIYVEANRLRLNPLAIETLGIATGDRVAINYQVSAEGAYPVIGVPEAFGIGLDGGNILTKSGTVRFKGVANEELSKYGTTLMVIPLGRKLFKLKPLTDQELDEIEETDNNNILDIQDSNEISFDLGENSKPEDFIIDPNKYQL